MAGIIDNKKIAELVIQQDAHNYEKINPETLATIVEDVTKVEGGKIDATVQEHIDDQTIHLTAENVTELTANNLTAENIRAGNNITIVQEEGTNNLTISAGEVPTDEFLTGKDIIPEDTTITITPIENTNQIHIRANIPDVSKFVEQENIRAGNDRIIVELDPESNDVTLYGVADPFKAGEGIKIAEDGTITNTMPDKIITLNEGSNITIEGTYPEFTISSTDKVKISDWKPSVEYQLDDFCIYDNSLFKCIEEHTSGTVFDSTKWQLIAGWSAKRQFFDIIDSTDVIELSDTVPNKDVLIVNVGGVLQQSQNYDLEPDGKTIKFINPIPANTIVEVMVMSNVVLDTYDNKVNIQDWKPNTSFAVGNICIYDSSIYQCVNRHISSSLFEKENWKLICGYVKNSYFYTAEQELTTITLPTSVYKTSDILVNVGNTLLQSNNYTLDSTGQIITFVEPIEAGAEIEIIVFGNAVLQQSEVPTPTKPNEFLISNQTNTGYDLVDTSKVIDLLNLETLVDFENNANKIVSINSSETDFTMLSPSKLSGNVGVRNIVEGFETSVIMGTKPIEYPGMTKTKNDKLKFEAGSVMSLDKSVLIRLTSPIIKNPNEEFKRGDESGCMIGTGQDLWTPPVMTSNNTPYGVIVTSEAQTDREGYRAMDGLHGTGNGWLANNTTATWEYSLPYDFIVTEIDFYNQTSGINNHSKDIDLWVDEHTNIVASFTALDEDYGHSHVVIPNPVAGKTFGLTIKNSYGQAVGANEIDITANYINNLSSNAFIYVYAIGNEDGTLNDIATSYYNEKEFANHLPNNYTKYGLIKTFRTDSDWNIDNIYPQQNIKDALINGSINGTLYNNSHDYYIHDDTNDKSVHIIEQWGDTVPVNGVVTFPFKYKNKLLWVMANGEKILTKSTTGFTVDTSVTTAVSWVAKGY